MCKIRWLSFTFTVLISLLTSSCDPGQPSGSTDFVVSGYAASLSQSEFNQLPPEQQYEVANKLLGTMLRGVSVEDFFDLNAGMTKLIPSSSTFLQDSRANIANDLPEATAYAIDAVIDGLDSEGNPIPSDAKYNMNGNDRPRSVPLSRIKEYPLSRDMLVHWMAYFLSNTIMFSPALEMESTDIGDAQNMYRFLVLSLDEGRSVRDIVRSNLSSLARWRVSRSPENHALEAFEIYLGLFETEEDSLRGGVACKDLYLTSASEDYLIRRTDFPNTVPQLILDTHYVTTCDDLYDVIAGHELLMPRVTEVIVNYLFSGRALNDRTRIISSIVNSGPQTFDDIFIGLIFSREYLLNTERPKSFEENMMSLLDRLRWSASANVYPVDENIFRNMTSQPLNASNLYMPNMGWHSMSLKIGRLPEVPLNVLNFSNYHKALRENLLIRRISYRGGINGVDGLVYNSKNEVKVPIAKLSLDDYIDFLFMSAIYRKATALEKFSLKVVYDYNGHLKSDGSALPSRLSNISEITYDYISRLHELYYFKAVS